MEREVAVVSACVSKNGGTCRTRFSDYPPLLPQLRHAPERKGFLNTDEDCTCSQLEQWLDAICALEGADTRMRCTLWARHAVQFKQGKCMRLARSRSATSGDSTADRDGNPSALRRVPDRPSGFQADRAACPAH
jgi:hypothetical protein